MKTNYLILNTSEHSSDIEYRLEVEKKENSVIEYNLFTAGEVWSEDHKNKLLCSVIDDGNGLSFQVYENEIKAIKPKHGSNITLKFDYGVFGFLKLLMNSITSLDENIMGHYKLVPDNDLISI